MNRRESRHMNFGCRILNPKSQIKNSKFLLVIIALLTVLLSADCSWASVKIVKYISPLQGAFDRTTTNTTYEDLGEDYKVIFYWDSTKYTSATVYFEAVLASSDASGMLLN